MSSIGGREWKSWIWVQASHLIRRVCWMSCFAMTSPKEQIRSNSDTEKQREKEKKPQWKIKCLILVFLSLLLMPVWIMLPLRTGNTGKHLKHVLEEGSVTWQFHAWMECSYIGCMREWGDVQWSLIVNESLSSPDKKKGKLLLWMSWHITDTLSFPPAMSACHHGAETLSSKCSIF